MSAPNAPTTTRTHGIAPVVPATARGRVRPDPNAAAPTRTRSGPRRARAGFTTLELLVVMAIVGILAGLGWVNLPRDRFAAREAARVLAADMNRARSEAIRLNTHVALQFGGPGCGDYCLYTDPGRSGSPDGNLDGDAAGTTEIASPMLLRRTVAGEFPRVALSATGFGASGTVWFDVRGLPRTDAGAYLGDTATATIRPRGTDAGFRVTLEPQGRIQVASE